MKTFKYKFSKLLTALIWAGVALCVAGFAVNLWRCIAIGVDYAADPVYPIIQYTLMFFVTVLLAILLITIYFNSCYQIDGKTFKTRFGILVSKYDVEKIESIVLDRKTDKLSVTFTDGSYIVVVVRQDWYNDFVQAVLDANPKIEYSIRSIENDGEDKNKK